MLVRESKNKKQLAIFLNRIAFGQAEYEQSLTKIDRKRKGVFLTNSLSTVENVLNVVDISPDILQKRILEPSCGQGIFILKLITDVYSLFPDSTIVSKFISNSIFFVDIQEEMIEKTISNIKSLYHYLFEKDYEGSFNSLIWDFTDKRVRSTFAEKPKDFPFTALYGTFDYVIGNPPYVTLYGRRDKKVNEEQRIRYLKNYSQFPDSVKNGKLNLVMLFIEHALDFLKDEGTLSFIIDVSFFETAYEYTRKFVLENTRIQELHVNIKDFDAVSGQVILKVSKSNGIKDNEVRIEDHKTKQGYFIKQSSWLNGNDEYKFRYNGCSDSRRVIDKINATGDKTLLELFPRKNLRTCTMLLDMEDKFTCMDVSGKAEELVYPYYQGSKALNGKYSSFSFSKYFFYNKPLQDTINESLRVQLEKAGIKNKKRIGLGETIIYDNPKLYIRQSAKEIIASVDLSRSAANNSLYVFSLRNNSPGTMAFLYFLCGWLNSDLVTYYAQHMNVIRYSRGKQPQIKISDLGTIFIPSDINFQNRIAGLCKTIYDSPSLKHEMIVEINATVYAYYNLSSSEMDTISASIKAY